MKTTEIIKALQPSKFTKDDFVKLLDIETDPVIIKIMQDILRLTPDHKFKLFSDGISLGKKSLMENKK